MAKGVKSAFVWSAIERFALGGVTFVLGIILARLLSPAEFGLVGMLAVFFAVANSFANSGFSSALIQRAEVSDDDTTSVFWLNIGAALLLMLTLMGISPWVAVFFRQPALQALLCVLSLQVVLSSLCLVQDALRLRDLDFKTQAIAGLTATLLSGTTGIIMAWKGFGVWSLVTQALSRAALYSALLWMLRPWRPRGRFRWACVHAMWPFSSRLLGAGLLDSVFSQLHAVLIGRFYSAADLGLFTRAKQIEEMPSHLVNGIVGRVTFPYFSRLQDDKALLKNQLRRILRILASVHFPVMIAIAVTAEPLVIVLLTDKWIGCVPYLRVLGIVGLLYPFHVIHLGLLQAQGRSDLFLRLEVIKKLLSISTLILTAQISVLAIACGMLFISTVAYFLNTFYTRKLIQYTWTEQWRDVAALLTTAVLAGGGAWLTALVHAHWPSWAVLLAQGAVMVAVYGVIGFSMRSNTFSDPWNVVLRLTRRDQIAGG